ncbi:MAG: hypothetical protein IJO97_02285 [Lachnospiraceae bacterium]|nr:hypothetical protein [Lachnospiraceae bacterium]
MGLILSPSEVRSYIGCLQGYLESSIECYNDAKQKVDLYIATEGLASVAWAQSKETMQVCYQAITEGMLSVQESFLSDLSVLDGALGDEYLDEDALEAEIRILEAECQQYKNNITQWSSMLQSFSNGGFSTTASRWIETANGMIESTEAAITELREKIIFLHEVEDTTVNLFQSVVDFLSIVSSAIHDGGVTISGSGEYSVENWSKCISDLIKTIEEKEISQRLEEALIEELGISLEEFKKIFGEDALEEIYDYMNDTGIYKRENALSSVIVAKAIGVCSGKYIVVVDGKYEFCNKKTGEMSSYTSDELSELIKNNADFLDGIEEIEVYGKQGTSKEPLPDEQQTANVEYIYDYLRQEGWSKEAICGALGNINEESHFNPGVWQDAENIYLGYGLTQWDDGADFLAWAGLDAETANYIANNSPQRLMDKELEFLLITCNPNTTDTQCRWYGTLGYNSPYDMSFEEYKVSTHSVGDLALVFHGSYERSADGEKGLSERIAAAEAWYEYFN